jgi:membrane protease YdiL (CAAX protease family)
MRYPSTVSDLLLSILIVITTEAYIWLLATQARWTVVIPVALVGLLWRRQSQTPASLGLRFSSFVLSLRQWYVLWILSTALFLFLGRHVIFNTSILLRGCLYFIWCTLQQLLYQSVIWAVVRKRLASRWTAALVSGLVFASLHIPNPVLIPGTLLWGVFSSLLFENCRSVIGLALLQVMLSSMLMWVTPYHLHRGFRTGPSYYRVP